MTKTKETIIVVHPMGDYHADMTVEQFEKGLLTIREVPEEELIDKLSVQVVYDYGLTDAALMRRVIEASPGYDPDEENEDDYRLTGQLTPIGLVRWSIARSGIDNANSGEEKNYAWYENIAFKLTELDDNDDSGEE
jgi:hypothetical protein